MKTTTVSVVGTVLLTAAVFGMTHADQTIFAQQATATATAAARTPTAAALKATEAVQSGRELTATAALSPTGVMNGGLITVDGIGQASVVPDTVVIEFGVNNRAVTASVALSQTNAEMNALIEKLIDVGVARADIQTQVISLFPIYDQLQNQGGTAVLTGYDATNIARVRVVASEDLGALIDAAVEAGANTIQGIHFESSKQGDALARARVAAFSDARSKADQLVALSGSKLGPIHMIVESGSTTPLMATQNRVAAAGRIETGTQHVQVVIQITWQLAKAAP